MSDRDVNRYQRKIERLRDPAGLVAAQRTGRHGHALRRPRGRHQLHDRRRQPAARAPAGHPGRRQRAVEGRRHRGHDRRASGWSPPPASSARATPSSSRACPTRSPTSSRRSATRRELLTALEDDDYVASYREDADDPDISVGWDLELEDAVTAPAYDGLLDLSYAVPLADARGTEPAGAAPRSVTGGRVSVGVSRRGLGRRRRLGRLDERRHHDRDRRALGRRLAGVRALLDHGAGRLGGVGVLDDPRLEAGVADRRSRASRLRSSRRRSGTSSRPSEKYTMTVVPSATISPCDGVGADHDVLRLVGLLLLERRRRSPAPRAVPAASSLSWPITNGTSTSRLAERDHVGRPRCPGRRTVSAVGVLPDDLAGL